MPVDTDDLRPSGERFASLVRGAHRVPDRRRRHAPAGATGWMHNRVRMIVASFLVKDLHLPWQWGARFFMDHLSTAIWPRTTTAGSGRPGRHRCRAVLPGVQPHQAQQERWDPTATYVHAVGARGRGADYEAPMVDHAAERLEALGPLRGGEGHPAASRRTAHSIDCHHARRTQDRHPRAVVQEYIATAQPVGSTTSPTRPGSGVVGHGAQRDGRARAGGLPRPAAHVGRAGPDRQGLPVLRRPPDHAGIGSTVRSTRQVGEFFAAAHGRLEEMLHQTSEPAHRPHQLRRVVVGPKPEAARCAACRSWDCQPTSATVVVVFGNGAVESETDRADDDDRDRRARAAAAVTCRRRARGHARR
jgi:hypothetical protein